MSGPGEVDWSNLYRPPLLPVRWRRLRKIKDPSVEVMVWGWCGFQPSTGPWFGCIEDLNAPDRCGERMTWSVYEWIEINEEG